MFAASVLKLSTSLRSFHLVGAVSAIKVCIYIDILIQELCMCVYVCLCVAKINAPLSEKSSLRRKQDVGLIAS